MLRPWEIFLADLRAPARRDPAAHGWLEVVLCYPGFHAVLAHRFIHPLAGIPILARCLSQAVRFFTGIEIHPAARLGPGVFIDHGMGVVIGETAEVGGGCTIYQGVTLGGTSLSRGKRHPTLGRDVTVGVNAAVLGAVRIGDGAKIGGGSVVVHDVPAGATVVGIPARVVALNGAPVRAVPDRPKVEMPDPHADALTRMGRRLEALERRLSEVEATTQPDDEPWSWVI